MATDIIPSESSTLVDDGAQNDILDSISPFFCVQDTKYGGNGCFSASDLKIGTTVLTAKNSLSSTIARPFRKEVCNFCFKYDNGTTMKHKLELKGFSNYLYFCTAKCASDFDSQDDQDRNYLRTLLKLEQDYISCLKKPELEEQEPASENLVQTIYDEWKKVDDWDQQIHQKNKKKWNNLIPRIDEAEYLEIKYVLGVLFQMHKQESTEIGEGFYQDLSDDKAMKMELGLFEYLQSSEISKVLKYPYLLYSYIRMYKFIRLSALDVVQKFINPLTIRLIIGRNLTNAFGIWSKPQNSEEDKEFLGFSVFPSGSFFNHSCAPNLIKKTINNELHFITTKEVAKGDELCIDYGNYLQEDLETRRQQLNEWFFLCQCKRCIEESN